LALGLTVEGRRWDEKIKESLSFTLSFPLSHSSLFWWRTRKNFGDFYALFKMKKRWEREKVTERKHG
jgi:hypothetical protein